VIGVFGGGGCRVPRPVARRSKRSFVEHVEDVHTGKFSSGRDFAFCGDDLMLIVLSAQDCLKAEL
jgi:hypothetical protein